MILETDRLIIRPPEPEDVESAIRIWCDPEVRRFSGGAANPEKVRRAFLNDLSRPHSKKGMRTVIEKSTEEHIGDAGLLEKSISGNLETELVFFFLPSAWGKGFATEAAKVIKSDAEKRLKINRLVALVHPDNLASKKVVAKLGMTFEKTVVTESGKARELFVSTPRAAD